MCFALPKYLDPPLCYRDDLDPPPCIYRWLVYFIVVFLLFLCGGSSMALLLFLVTPSVLYMPHLHSVFILSSLKTGTCIIVVAQ